MQSLALHSLSSYIILLEIRCCGSCHNVEAEVNIHLLSAICPADIESVTAVRTVDHSCKRTYRTAFQPSFLVAAYLLHKVKIVLRNNRLMGVFDDKPVLLRIFIQLLVFVGLAVVLEVDRVTVLESDFDKEIKKLKDNNSK